MSFMYCKNESLLLCLWYVVEAWAKVHGAFKVNESKPSIANIGLQILTTPNGYISSVMQILRYHRSTVQAKKNFFCVTFYHYLLNEI